MKMINEADIIKQRDVLEKKAGLSQAEASNPKISVWVEASAGTGKTKVLSDRVLRLLLEGVQPSKILCLTYTKAAAVEMNNRIYHRLSKWAVAEKEDLEKELTDLFADGAIFEKKKDLAARARTLFASVLDANVPIKIQTIHSFCEEILKRFPLEAGVSPYFEVMDDRTTAEALRHISKRVLQEIENFEQKEIRESVLFLTANMKEFGFEKLLLDLTSHRNRLIEVISAFDNVDAFLEALRKKLNLDEKPSREKILGRFQKGIEEDEMRCCVNALLKGSKTDKEHGAFLAEALEAFDFDIYKKAFLTQGNKTLDTFAHKDAVCEMININEVMGKEALRILDVIEELKNLRIYETTKAVFVLAKRLIDEYGAYKRQNARMDYEDLIVLTKKLIESKNVAAWVLFKLDEGISHILIDEAQDTSPNQWAIVRALTDEFFSGVGQTDEVRSVFAVGDKKQSIYRFQGAEPEKFDEMNKFYANQVKNFKKINLDVSFRSTGAVLDFVNALFAIDGASKGLVSKDEKILHLPYRLGESGKVELWGLVENKSDDEDDDETWQVPFYVKQKERAEVKLALKIALKIKKMVEGKEILVSKGRPLKYSDFMVLVQRRSGFMDAFVKACKNSGVAVTGVDKLKLNHQICVQDLLSLSKFLLLPFDDLSLAEVLKSPLFDLTDDDLFELCYDRGHTPLWQKLKANPKYENIGLFLSELLLMADLKRPYEIFSFVLDVYEGKKKFLSRLGEEAADALSEFMNLALDFETDHVPNLQNFVRFMEENETEVKREMEQISQDAVRIMTVHGSKGLQAPVVILPDTIREPWINRAQGAIFDEDLVYFPLSAGDYNETCERVYEKEKEKAYEEYRRLLYVALTRAEDRLYIAGFGRPKKEDLSWYKLCEQAMENKGISKENGIFGFETPQQIEQKKQEKKIYKFEEKDCSFAFKPAPKEAALGKPYLPSHIDENDDTPVASPLVDEGFFYQRGLIIHKLLQMLPQYENKKDLKSLVETYLAKQSDLSDKARREILTEVSALLNDESFSFIFGENSRAEVPVMGEVDGKIISGQIDRLVVLKDKVIVVDFKTNRPAALTRDMVPDAYIKQLEIYRKLLEKVYEGKKVETYILWTNVLKLMKI